ncbi:hypothetical protein JCM10213v2_008089 [Rhodosporidiobolus nylandii]
MPRRRRQYSPDGYSDASVASSLYAAPPTDRSPSPPPRWPPLSDRTVAPEPPKLRADDRALSAEQATRLMLRKWDAMDEAVEEKSAVEGGRGGRRGRKGRASSMPTPRPDGRRMSRVREWELWRREGEAIRLAQVEMERRLDEEKEEHQREAARLEVEQLAREERSKSKVATRKATPRFVVSSPSSSDEEDGSDWNSTGRRSATTSMASTGSPPPSLRDSDEAEEPKERSRRKRELRRPDEEDARASRRRRRQTETRKRSLCLR